jgi:uncharacterized SAM-binding protein YcdF (DUF218 family)
MKFISSMLLLCLILSSLWLGGFLYFINYINKQGNIPHKSEAIVVLTGGSDRVKEGMSLLIKNIAPLMFISGANVDVRAEDLLQDTETPKEYWDVLKHYIVIGKQAVDTYGNAKEAEQWLITNNIKSFILITSNYHMPRALIEFSRLDSNIKIFPYPITSPNIETNQWWKYSNSLKFLINEYHKYLAAMIRINLIQT